MLEICVNETGKILCAKKYPAVWSEIELDSFLIIHLDDAIAEANVQLITTTPYKITEDVETPDGVRTDIINSSPYSVDMSSINVDDVKSKNRSPNDRLCLIKQNLLFNSVKDEQYTANNVTITKDLLQDTAQAWRQMVDSYYQSGKVKFVRCELCVAQQDINQTTREWAFCKGCPFKDACWNNAIPFRKAARDGMPVEDIQKIAEPGIQKMLDIIDANY